MQKYLVYMCLLLMGLGWSLAGVDVPEPVMEWYISSEQGGYAGSGSLEDQELLAREVVDMQDNAWRGAISGAMLVKQISFGTGEIQRLAAQPYNLTSGEKDLATMQRVQLTAVGLGVPNGTSTQPYLDNASVLQDDAPFPASLVGERFWHEKLGGSSSQRNAVRFTIASGLDIRGFGVWIGDLETRSDGEGWPAEMYLFDESDALIERKVIDVDNVDQSTCGSDLGGAGCGDKTTRWVGFLVPDDLFARISHIVIVVGDDDSGTDQNTIGTTEHFSLIGPTFVYACDDRDSDGVCDIEDVCPDNPEKALESGCGCDVLDPVNFGMVCESDANICGETTTGTIGCDGLCSAVIPDDAGCSDTSSGSGGGPSTDTSGESGSGSSTDTSSEQGTDTDTQGSSGTGDNNNTGTNDDSDQSQDAPGSGFVLPGSLPDTGADFR